jgi:hypothetical protein
MGLDKYFSERRGYRPSKVKIQVESMDGELRTALWNALCQTFWAGVGWHDDVDPRIGLGRMLYALWTRYLKGAHDEFPGSWGAWQPLLKKRILGGAWHEVYEIIEFMMKNWEYEYQVADEFTPILNEALERELSGYRIIDGVVTPITDQAEIAEIEQALATGGIFRPVQVQLEEALQKLSDRDGPDYRGSIKDSISAVETLCRFMSNEPHLELGSALKVLEQSGKVKIHAALRKGFASLYGWTSDDQGIRHGLMDEPDLTFEDAKYMLVACSAFMNYLIAKAAQAGLELHAPGH